MIQLEISKDDELHGVVNLGWDGTATLTGAWLKEILDAGGYSYEEVCTRDF